MRTKEFTHNLWKYFSWVIPKHQCKHPYYGTVHKDHDKPMTYNVHYKSLSLIKTQFLVGNNGNMGSLQLVGIASVGLFPPLLRVVTLRPALPPVFLLKRPQIKFLLCWANSQSHCIGFTLGSYQQALKIIWYFGSAPPSISMENGKLPRRKLQVRVNGEG